MTEELEQILDRCIDRLNSGEKLEACLADYPQYADQLRPLFQAMSQTKVAYAFAPAVSAKEAARQRLTVALEKLAQKRQVKQPWFARPLAWATLAAVLLVLIVTYIGVRPALSPVLPITPTPSPDGNFVFLVSDEVNAIADFSSLTITISKIGLQQQDSGKWVEFQPEIAQVDLTQVQGDAVQEVWRGNTPQAQYQQVFIYIDHVQGILKATGETVEVKLPSKKIHIAKPFEVSGDSITSFTYDLTVVSAGNQQSGIKYLLKPQLDQSGASQQPRQTKDNGNNDNRTRPNPAHPANLPSPTSQPKKED